MPCGIAWQARQAPAAGPLPAPADGLPAYLSPPAAHLLVGVSVYREPIGRNAVLFQIGELSPGDGDLTGDSAAGETVPRPAAGSASGTGPLLGIGPALAPRAPYQPPANLAELVSECEASSLLTVSKMPRGQSRAAGDIPPVFVEPRTAAALHRELLATGRGDEVTHAHQRAAEYWQWRATAWPQDQDADVHDLLEARYHQHEAGGSRQAIALTEMICAQLHAWGQLDREAALIRETMAWLPPRSPQRASWIQEIGKIAQVRGDYTEARRRYQQSLEIYARAGDASGVSRSHHLLGVLAQTQGDYAEAERRYQQSSSPAPAALPGRKPGLGRRGGPSGGSRLAQALLRRAARGSPPAARERARGPGAPGRAGPVPGLAQPGDPDKASLVPAGAGSAGTRLPKRTPSRDRATQDRATQDRATQDRASQPDQDPAAGNQVGKSQPDQGQPLRDQPRKGQTEIGKPNGTPAVASTPQANSPQRDATQGSSHQDSQTTPAPSSPGPFPDSSPQADPPEGSSAQGGSRHDGPAFAEPSQGGPSQGSPRQGDQASATPHTTGPAPESSPQTNSPQNGSPQSGQVSAGPSGGLDQGGPARARSFQGGLLQGGQAFAGRSHAGQPGPVQPFGPSFGGPSLGGKAHPGQGGAGPARAGKARAGQAYADQGLAQPYPGKARPGQATAGQPDTDQAPLSRATAPAAGVDPDGLPGTETEGQPTEEVAAEAGVSRGRVMLAGAATLAAAAALVVGIVTGALPGPQGADRPAAAATGHPSTATGHPSTASPAPGHQAQGNAAARIRAQTAAWAANNLSRSDVVLCDPAMCAALLQQGFPAGNLLTLSPSANLSADDVVIATAAVRSMFGSRLTHVFAPEVEAAIGSGSVGIQVRVVAPDGARAYRAALRQDIAGRRRAGSTLARNSRITATPAARHDLTAGRVDSRLLTILPPLANAQPVRILSFGADPGASPGMPMSSMDISLPVQRKSHGPPAGRLHSARVFLAAQQPPYLAMSERVIRRPGRPPVLRIGFGGPGPLGLLAGGSLDSAP